MAKFFWCRVLYRGCVVGALVSSRRREAVGSVVGLVVQGVSFLHLDSGSWKYLLTVYMVEVM
jgi:hypothetical protein